MLSSNGSINHHYIPQFYLDGFCRQDGTFDVYDKHFGKFKKAPQTPAVVFFERKRNNIKYRGHTTDVIEQLFSALCRFMWNLTSGSMAGNGRCCINRV